MLNLKQAIDDLICSFQKISLNDASNDDQLNLTQHQQVNNKFGKGYIALINCKVIPPLNLKPFDDRELIRYNQAQNKKSNSQLRSQLNILEKDQRVFKSDLYYPTNNHYCKPTQHHYSYYQRHNDFYCDQRRGQYLFKNQNNTNYNARNRNYLINQNENNSCYPERQNMPDCEQRNYRIQEKYFKYKSYFKIEKHAGKFQIQTQGDFEFSDKNKTYLKCLSYYDFSNFINE